jgi:FKBP-type peptidyl-prolyl cis-trans isomerase
MAANSRGFKTAAAQSRTLVVRMGVFSALGLVAVLGLGCEQKPQVKSDTDKEAYMIGFRIGSSFQQQGLTPDPKVILLGMQDGMKQGAKPAISEEDSQSAMQRVQSKVMAHMQGQMETQGKKGIEEGKSYLEKNKTKEGVKTTSSGLQYEVVKEGKGPKPSASDRVKVHYTGTLIDGTKFDSSRDSGQPAEFGVGEVIRGWQEALQLMPVGSQFKLAIPSELAYGPQPTGNIPPNSVLLFDVELLEIVKGSKGKPGK